MSRYRGPKLRIVRRLGELPGLTQKVCVRNFPPGQHGPKKKLTGSQKAKESQYAIRLKEKQKLRFNYGINERQLLKYIREARRRKGSTGEVLLQLLETRLDNVIFRLGFAPTIAAARQLVAHGHILVNQHKINIPSYICKINDVIGVCETSRPLITKSLNSLGLPQVPSFLDLDQEKLSAVVTNSISRDMVGLNINELLVVEYYSRKV
uniref:Small ribosomal subunit protein uS4c n=1 Tax=Parachlorella kessleri TaxID=3074 RepID=C7BET3_PARKE|nr:ribosomal protein S4 [Parachlorella kessleri]ACQ90974.1 ribosomal protein S4 [Parachlorella kessleri]